MPETPNHRYNIPALGEEDWDQLLNANFEKMDSEVEIRDTEANKGEYQPKEGAKYEATDSGAVYVGNGETWVLTDRQVRALQTEETTVEEAVFSNSDERTGALLVDRNNDYRAVSMVTDEYWTDGSDAGVVLNALIDAIGESRGVIGEICVGRGRYVFDTPVVVDDNQGMTLTGQTFRQGNSQSGSTFVPGDLQAGRGILEIGNIGDRSDPGGGEATHIKNLYMDLHGQNVAGIYNWAQDRVRTSDVKIENPGPAGNGVVYIGSFNANIVDSYFDQAAFLKNNPRSKDTNSLRFHNVTFNTNNPGHPPIILFTQGCRITNGIFNGVDGPGMEDGLAIVSDDISLVGILDADPRIDEDDLKGQLSRIQFSACAFVTGGNDVRVFNGIERGEFTSCRFSSSGRAINGFTRSAFSACRFSGVGKEALYRPGKGGGATSSITGCTFKNFGQDDGEPAIRFAGSTNHRVSVTGNSFRSTNGADNDIVLENNANCILVSGNWCDDGISATVGGARIGSPRQVVSKVVGNSANPVGFDRPTPSVPDGLGPGSATANLHAQGAWVHHDGSGVNVDAFGSTRSLSTDASPVFVPRAGAIYFDSEAPSAWDWWWV